MLHRTASDTVGDWSIGKEEDHGAVFLCLLYVHHPTLWLCREVKWTLVRVLKCFGFFFNKNMDPPFIRCYCFWFICSRASMTVLIFIARAFIAGGFQAAYVYTPEVKYRQTEWGFACVVWNVTKDRASFIFSDTLQVYPTATRALGLGTSSGMARVGALITPFVAQVTTHYQFSTFKYCTKWESGKVITFVCPSALFCRLCWSPLYTWLSRCTAAAASLLPLPPVHYQLRQRAGACRSPATMSGARKWWAGPPPKAQGESLTPAPAPRAEEAPAGVQPRGDCSGEKRQGEGKKS